jgi:hypothetical protein
MDNSLCVESPPGTTRKGGERCAGWQTGYGPASLAAPRTPPPEIGSRRHTKSGHKKSARRVWRGMRRSFGLPSPVAELAATGELFTWGSSSSRVRICSWHSDSLQSWVVSACKRRCNSYCSIGFVGRWQLFSRVVGEKIVAGALARRRFENARSVLRAGISIGLTPTESADGMDLDRVLNFNETDDSAAKQLLHALLKRQVGELARNALSSSKTPSPPHPDGLWCQCFSSRFCSAIRNVFDKPI